MRPAIFADACYWIALLYERDALHRVAARLAGELALRQLVTSEMVLAEVLNFFGKFGAAKRRSAAEFVQRLSSNPGVDIVEQTTERFWDAVAFYAARPDQQWGLVDCASFQVMTAWNIQEALTNDHHFEQAGFTILMR